MAVTANQLLANRATVTIPAEGGGELRIVYRPRSMTPRVIKAIALLDELGDRASTAEALAAMAAFTGYLADVVIAWNLEYPDDDGNPSGVTIPPTREGMDDVAYDTQAVIMQAIQADMKHAKTNGRKSSKR